jgi:RNA ligase (TIGR02306 family)
MASIQIIADIQPIEGADKIVKTQINSWWVVTAIDNNFKVGDLVVYCETDSWIPHDLAPFLSKGKEPREYNGIKGEKLRTIKLKGQVSQGLILPIDVMNIKTDTGEYLGSWEEGYDVSETLGIIKYEPPIPACLSGIMRGNFPSQIPKTDESRIQNLTKEWYDLSQYQYEVTEKLEGSSCTMALVDGEFVVCSRNINIVESDDNTFWKMAKQYEVERKMRNESSMNFAIQGEVIGEGIQGNHYGIKGQDFYVFAIYDITAQKYVPPRFRMRLCEILNMKHVPIIDEFASFAGLEIDHVLKQADGKSRINANVMREGLVFKRVDGQEHFKAVSNEYLIKSGT